MTPVIVPYQFSWPDTQVEFPHLEFIDVPGGKRVSWNLVVFELRDDYGYEEEEESANHDPDIKTSPPIVNNLEPLCFL
jgi:hypothetical protein